MTSAYLTIPRRAIEEALSDRKRQKWQELRAELLLNCEERDDYEAEEAYQREARERWRAR